MDTVLFDLDGTLLPMDQDHFMEIYFRELSKKCAPLGARPDQLVAAVWDGIKSMVKNDGNATNEERFWTTFAAVLGEKVMQMKPDITRFYDDEFHLARAATKENPLGARLVRRLKQQGYGVVLATNPLFPPNAVQSRLSWTGLNLQDFDHVTCYNNAHYCKPNPKYYEEILETIGKSPEDCLMVGNDVREDGCVAKLGMDFFLVTDCLIDESGTGAEGMQAGDFAACVAYIDARMKNAG